MILHKTLTSCFLLFIIISFNCCNSIENEVVEYYPTGEIKSKTEFIDSLRNGVGKSYYKNGQIKSVLRWVNDTLNGEGTFFDSLGRRVAIVNYKKGVKNGRCIDFFSSNGYIRSDANFREGILHGTLIFFRENDSAVVESKINYINYHGEAKEMGGIFYDSLGHIIEQERRVSLTCNKDTFSLNEQIELNLELLIPSFDSTFFIIGDYDEKFNVIDKSKFDTLHALNHKHVIVKKASSQGEHFIRGFAKNWEVIEKTEEETKTVEKFPIYFEYRYFVR